MSEQQQQPPSKALAVVQAKPLDLCAYEPNSFGEVRTLAVELVKSQVVGVRNAADALALLMCGRELGMTAMQAIRSFHVIEGRPTLSAQAMHGLILSRGVAKYFGPKKVKDANGNTQTLESNERVTWVTHRVGQPEPVEMTWTIEEAKRAGLTGKANWSKYPKNMLRSRVIADLARTVYPDIIGGYYSSEEVGDGEIIDVTPRDAAQAGADIQAVEEASPERKQVEVLRRLLWAKLQPDRVRFDKIWKNELKPPKTKDEKKVADYLERARRTVAKYLGVSAEELDKQTADEEPQQATVIDVEPVPAETPAPEPSSPARGYGALLRELGIEPESTLEKALAGASQGEVFSFRIHALDKYADDQSRDRAERKGDEDELHRWLDLRVTIRGEKVPIWDVEGSEKDDGGQKVVVELVLNDVVRAEFIGDAA